MSEEFRARHSHLAHDPEFRCYVRGEPIDPTPEQIQQLREGKVLGFAHLGCFVEAASRPTARAEAKADADIEDFLKSRLYVKTSEEPTERMKLLSKLGSARRMHERAVRSLAKSEADIARLEKALKR